LFAPGNNRVVYPYFFLNFETLGLAGSIKWVAIMVAVTLCFGYLFWLIIYLKNATNRASATSKLKSFYAKINRQK
jgi:dolichyl-phosphate-mannose--protein O-mannosyl transferase